MERKKGTCSVCGCTEHPFDDDLPSGTGYFISQWPEARKDFRRVFGTDIVPFYDGPTTVAFCRICIDIAAFDEWLHRRFGDYEDRGLSMRDVVIENYGIEGDKLLDKLI
jgi:hypothetical protein